jgi:hypothetical protein
LVFESGKVPLSKSAPYLDPGHSQFDTRTSFAPLLPQLTPVFSPVFTSFASVTTPLCLDASLLANRPDTVLTTHALGVDGLRDEGGGSDHDGRDCEAVENSHLKLLRRRFLSQMQLFSGSISSRSLSLLNF